MNKYIKDVIFLFHYPLFIKHAIITNKWRGIIVSK